MAAAFLFDLDMTLVNSAALSDWRRAGMWPHVKAHLQNLVLPFATGRVSPHQLPAVLKDDGHAVGVVTSSPRWYAEKILTAFTIPYDVLVAYEDTDAHKPSPEPIKLAIEKLGATPSNTAYIGDDPIDVEAAYHAGVHSFGAAWGISDLSAMSVSAPDILLKTPKAMLTKSLVSRMYFGEVRAKGKEPDAHWGSIIRCGGTPMAYAVGRYYKASDPRHAGHEFSKLLLELKNDDSPAQVLARATADAVARLDWSPDYVVPIPPKPSQERHRFSRLLEALDSILPSDIVTADDGLKCLREIAGYKGLDPLQRAAAIRGVFESQYTWDNCNVLLLDDVLNTGATLGEAARVLRASGAKDVRVLALGRAQKVFQYKTCPACGRSMKVRSGPYGQFWGCTGYPNECTNTENL